MERCAKRSWKCKEDSWKSQKGYKIYEKKSPSCNIQEGDFCGKTTEKKMRKEIYKKNNKREISIFCPKYGVTEASIIFCKPSPVVSKLSKLLLSMAIWTSFCTLVILREIDKEIISIIITTPF